MDNVLLEFIAQILDEPITANPSSQHYPFPEPSTCTVEPCSISSKQSTNKESDFRQFLALCEILPLVPSLVCSLKTVSGSKEPQLPFLPNITSLHVRTASTTYGK
ncbi:uncharacterized protein ARMOST_14379 [Armillaria ostoyae]|uniref:Uncharacterized protein n=1 Tax=Armillaria ostoyae TaxID=47428 RepID=A0A284RQF5_ARMOS|nr:uncharacterized protein ARMOST_14379 [Armillaria ostoyae]